MFRQYLKFACRSLLAHPGFGLAAILTLGVAIGLNTAMFSVVDGILLKPLPFTQPERLFSLQESMNRRGVPARLPLAPGNFLDYRKTARSADLVCFASRAVSLESPNAEPERYASAVVSQGWFALLGGRIIRGRDFTPEEFEPGRDEAVIISEGLWAERFSRDESTVGLVIQMSGRPRRIVGIVESRFNFPSTNKIWAPMVFTPQEAQNRSSHRLLTVGRLRPGMTIAQAQAEFSQILATLAAEYPAFNQGKGAQVEMLIETITGNVKPSLLILICSVGFVLAIACANVANLLLARGATRAGEFAIRASLGASRGQLIGQLLTESLLLSFLGGVLGLVLAVVAFVAFRHYAPEGLPRIDAVAMDARVVLYNLAGVVVTAFLFGLLPAIRLSRVDLHTTLKDRTRGGTVRNRLRSVLVITQVAFAIMLMTGAGLLIRSLIELSRVDLGFAPDHVLTLRVFPQAVKYDNDIPAQIRFGETILRNLEGLPGLVSSSITTSLPLQGPPLYVYSVEGGPVHTAATAPTMQYFAVSPGYFETLRIPILAGRGFRVSDNATAPKVVIVNESFVRTHFPDGRAVGRRMEIGLENPPDWREIVGVVKDVKSDGLDKGVRAQVYAPYLASPSTVGTQASSFSVAVRTVNDPEGLAASVRQAVLSADRGQPVWLVQTMERTIEQTLSRERFMLFLMTAFAGVAFLLAIIGLSGLLSYTVAQRTREIGIRLAVGAQPGTVVGLILRQALVLVVVGIAIGILGSLVVGRALANLLFHTSPQDPLTLAAICSLFLLTASVASLIPARRASAIDPAVTLRAE
jgi:putative ABC transport system permease protein